MIEALGRQIMDSGGQGRSVGYTTGVVAGVNPLTVTLEGSGIAVPASQVVSPGAVVGQTVACLWDGPRLVVIGETRDATLDQWTQYNFVVTGSVTNPTLGSTSNLGWHRRVGVIGHFQMSLIFHGGDSVGSGTWTFGLPTAWNVLGLGIQTGTAWVLGGGVDRGPTEWRVLSAGAAATIGVYIPYVPASLAHNTYAWSSATPDRVDIWGSVPLT
jgi:hypothetical protein